MVRLRKTDLIGLVGLVLLLAWTPAYYAQGPLEQELTGGTSFRVGQAREGDHITYGLRIEESDGAVHTFGPVLSISFGPHERGVAYGADRSLVFTLFPQNIETSHVRYVQNGSTIIYNYGPEGTVATRASIERVLNVPSDPASWVDRESLQYHHPCSSPHLLAIAGDTFRYVPGEAQHLLAEFTDNLQNDEDLRCNQSKDRLVNIAGTLDGSPVFGRHALRSDRIYYQWEAAAGDAPLKKCQMPAGWPLIDQGHGDPYLGKPEEAGIPFHVVAVRPFTYACDYRRHVENWYWLSPTHSLPLGTHTRYFDPQGEPLLTLALVPLQIERGTGPVLHLPRWESRDLEPRPPRDPPRLPTQPVGELEARPTPLAHGWTLPDLRRLFLEHADAEDATFAETAHLVEFGWHADGPIATPAVPYPAPLPVPAHPDLRYTSDWSLTFARQDGTMRMYEMRIQDGRPAGTTQVQVERRCPGQDQTCRGRPWDPQLNLVALDAVLEKITSALAPELPIAADRPGTSSRFRFDATPLLGEAGGIPTADWMIYASEDAYSRGGIDLRDGTVTAYSGAMPAQAPAIPDDQLEPQALRLPVRVDPLATHAAFGGLVLLLISLLIRVGSALKSGVAASFAALMYAKIRKDHALDHARRDAMLAVIQAEPGITPKELMMRLGIGWGTTMHHAETLRRNAFITEEREGRRRHLFDATFNDPAERRRIACLRDPNQAAFLAAVARRPGAPLKELVDDLPQDLSGASRTGAHLAALGLVKKHKVGRTARFYPSD